MPAPETPKKTLMQIPIEDAPTALIREIWNRWGGFIVTPRRHFYPDDVMGLVVPGPKGPQGLVTWGMDGLARRRSSETEEGEVFEIVTLDAFEPGHGVGTALLADAERRIAAEGAGKVVLVTANDNARALGFYVRRGYRLVRLHLDAFEEVFRAKPPKDGDRRGDGGVVLRDLWELEKPL